MLHTLLSPPQWGFSGTINKQLLIVMTKQLTSNVLRNSLIVLTQKFSVSYKMSIQIYVKSFKGSAKFKRGIEGIP